MITLIHEALRNRLQAVAPDNAAIGYGDIDVIFRKKMNCKGQANIPIFGFTMGGIAEWLDNASTTLAITGYPDAPPYPLPDSNTGLKILPVILTYNCYYLSDQMSKVNDFVGRYLFLNYSGLNNVEVEDPELAGVKYGYQIIFADSCELDKRGDEYEIGYQYVLRYNLSIRGPIREITDSSIIEKLHVKIYLEDYLAEVWEVG